MKKSVAKNYIYNLIYQLIALILPLITTPYLSRVLGAEGIGIYSYAISIVTYFTLFGSLGIAMYAQREIAYVQEDKEKRSRIFWELFSLRTMTLAISMILFYFVFARTGEYSTYYKILILEIIANIFDISAFFQGMEEFKKIIRRNLIVKCISIVCIFLFIKQPSDLYKYMLIYVLSNFIGNVSLWFYLPQYITKIKLKTLNLLKHLKPTIVLLIPQIATQIYTVLDKTMLGVLILEKSEVGYYEQAQKIVKMTMVIVTSLSSVMLPRMANKFANGEKEKIKKNVLTSFHFAYFLSIPMVLGMIIVAKDLVPWFLGREFEKSIYIIYVISPIMLLIGFSSVIGAQYLLPTKKQKEYTISVIVGAVVNLILNFILIPKFMSIGAAIGTVIAEMAVTGIQLYYVRKEFQIKEIFEMSVNYLIAGAIMLIAILLLNQFLLFRLESIIRMGIDVIIGVVVYFIILIILKDEFCKRLIERIIKLKYNFNGHFDNAKKWKEK